jgi:hypothetical protein
MYIVEDEMPFSEYGERRGQRRRQRGSSQQCSKPSMAGYKRDLEGLGGAAAATKHEAWEMGGFRMFPSESKMVQDLCQAGTKIGF